MRPEGWAAAARVFAAWRFKGPAPSFHDRAVGWLHCAGPHPLAELLDRVGPIAPPPDVYRLAHHWSAVLGPGDRAAVRERLPLLADALDDLARAC